MNIFDSNWILISDKHNKKHVVLKNTAAVNIICAQTTGNLLFKLDMWKQNRSYSYHPLNFSFVVIRGNIVIPSYSCYNIILFLFQLSLTESRQFIIIWKFRWFFCLNWCIFKIIISTFFTAKFSASFSLGSFELPRKCWVQSVQFLRLLI